MISEEVLQTIESIKAQALKLYRSGIAAPVPERYVDMCDEKLCCCAIGAAALTSYMADVPNLEIKDGKHPLYEIYMQGYGIHGTDYYTIGDHDVHSGIIAGFDDGLTNGMRDANSWAPEEWQQAYDIMRDFGRKVKEEFLDKPAEVQA